MRKVVDCYRLGELLIVQKRRGHEIVNHAEIACLREILLSRWRYNGREFGLACVTRNGKIVIVEFDTSSTNRLTCHVLRGLSVERNLASRSNPAYTVRHVKRGESPGQIKELAETSRSKYFVDLTAIDGKLEILTSVIDRQSNGRPCINIVDDYDHDHLYWVKRKPSWCSDVRWRIEMRRRANAPIRQRCPGRIYMPNEYRVASVN